MDRPRSKITLRNGSTITTKDIVNDGLALVSAMHPSPRPRWYDRFVLWFKPVPKLSPGSIEQMEITIGPEIKAPNDGR